MLTLFSERPVLLGLLLAALLAGSVMVWLRTGARGALLAAGVFLVLLPVLIAVERLWVTDREELRATIETVAAALERNDFDEVYRYVHPDAERTVHQARGELPKYEFRAARVTGYRSIEVASDRDPPEAVVECTVSVTASDRRGMMGEQRVPRRVRLHFRRSNGRWRVIDYQHFPIAGGADRYSTGTGTEIPSLDPGYLLWR